MAVAVPLGRKHLLWHTYEVPDTPVCYVIGLNKEKRPVSAERLDDMGPCPAAFAYGTLVYGTLVDGGALARRCFVAEDMYYFCGTSLAKVAFGHRMGLLKEYVQATTPHTALPVMWLAVAGEELSHQVPARWAEDVGYAVHHVQYRDIAHLSPYLNVPVPKRGTLSVHALPVHTDTQPEDAPATPGALPLPLPSLSTPLPVFDFRKPAFRTSAVFRVRADPQLDLYHLFAANDVYCGLAGIQTLRTSQFMNGLFRRIRENADLDLAEASDDEADFENMDCHKYVDLSKELAIRCVFNPKHKKWIPVEEAAVPVVTLQELVVSSPFNGTHRPPPSPKYPASTRFDGAKGGRNREYASAQPYYRPNHGFRREQERRHSSQAANVRPAAPVR